MWLSVVHPCFYRMHRSGCFPSFSHVSSSQLLGADCCLLLCSRENWVSGGRSPARPARSDARPAAFPAPAGLPSPLSRMSANRRQPSQCTFKCLEWASIGKTWSQLNIREWKAVNLFTFLDLFCFWSLLSGASWLCSQSLGFSLFTEASSASDVRVSQKGLLRVLSECQYLADVFK